MASKKQNTTSEVTKKEDVNIFKSLNFLLLFSRNSKKISINIEI